MTFLELFRGPARAAAETSRQQAALEHHRLMAINGSRVPYVEALDERVVMGYGAVEQGRKSLEAKGVAHRSLELVEVIEQPAISTQPTYAEYVPTPPRPEVHPSLIGRAAVMGDSFYVPQDSNMLTEAETSTKAHIDYVNAMGYEALPTEPA